MLQDAASGVALANVGRRLTLPGLREWSQTGNKSSSKGSRLDLQRYGHQTACRTRSAGR